MSSERVCPSTGPERSIAETEERLQQAEDEIRTCIRRRDQFLTMLSHELRNPLAAIVNAAVVMRSPNVNPESMETAREVVERQSRHMARLLDDLFDVSRILEGRFELNKEDIDLREVIRAAVETLTPSLEASPALLTTDLPTVELPVRGDARRIQHVVVHLLSNAVRYSPPGAHIQLSAHANADSVILKVKDHGRGISPSMLVDIFELFVQDDQGLERSSGGLGIGLTLVRRIVELHGGDVHAYSEGVGRGSEFVVRFPRIAHAVTNDERRESRSAPAQRRVLIVEDQDDSRKMLRMLLESMGHVVVEEADGASAVRTIQREHPDVALIDIGLPVMSGYEVAHHVRENGLLDDVVLVALTGYGRDADIAAARAAGFDAHVTKPADSQLLNDILAGRVRPFIRSFGMAFEN